MKLLFFVYRDELCKSLPLIEAVTTSIEHPSIEVLVTEEAFRNRLKSSAVFTEKEIFILFADSQDYLDKFSTFIDLMEGKQILLVLPDNSTTSLRKAPKFYPRYFTHINNTYDDLCAVLQKMTTKDSHPLKIF